MQGHIDLVARVKNKTLNMDVLPHTPYYPIPVPSTYHLLLSLQRSLE